MKKAIILLLYFSFTIIHGQENQVSEDIIESIKADVWIPFMEAYRDFDEERLKSIHTANIIRINIDDNKVRTGETYLNEFASFLPRMKDNGDKVGIAFAILTTAVDESKQIAYQTGYYQFLMQAKGEEKRTPRGYGYFHVGLKIDEGKWKIFLDSDKKVDMNPAQFEGKPTLYRIDY